MFNPRLILSLRPPAAVQNGRGPGVRVRLPDATLTFGSVRPGVRRALTRLLTGASDDELASIVGDDQEALTTWYYCVGVLERRGGVTYEVRQRDRPIARMIVTSPHFQSSARPGPSDRRWQLSRFAYVRREAARFILESPATCAKVELLDRSAMTMLASLGAPCGAHDVAMGRVPLRTAADFLALLEHAGMLDPVDQMGRGAEEHSQSLKTWHFADLLFHVRSRAGRTDEPFTIFRYLDDFPPLPAVKAPMSDRVIDLYVPKLEKRARRDRTLTRVLEERRSIRAYDRRPITLKELGEFLYRTARVKRIIEPDGKRILYQASVRPYPGGGACYELEIYIAVGRCGGLPVGLYHYDPLHHRLEVLSGGAAYAPQFLRDTLLSTAGAGPRQVLIVLAARFQRMSWKYNSCTYAAILKNVGVLYQTMYLVATAMNLAPCALGGGNSELFNRAVGTQFYDETSVGEFMLGTTRPSRR
ncbi:MAG: SagB family peptide dehydrogenase [Gemmatimonadaceae bacterium]